MFIVVYDVIASLARERPLLYVLEDLHFADSASLELLWFVASRASRVPILLLLAQRAGPGSPEPRPVRTNFTQLVLEPLSDEEAARIIEATFDWDDLGSWNALARHIKPDAEGNCAVGDFIHVDGARNIIFDARKNHRTPIAVVGLRDSILVQTDDATLLAHKSQAQKIKDLVKKLAESKEHKHLV